VSRGTTSLQIHGLLGWILVIATLYLIGYEVPTEDAMIGNSYLIFFFHFPSAVNCLNFFILAGIVSAVYLFQRRTNPRLDLWATAAIEVGVLACSITLVTGSIWAKAAWNMFWDVRDKRLLTVAVMWFTYVGLLALRANIHEPAKRARFCAVFALIAAVNVPLVYFSIKWFGKESHPMPSQQLLGAFSMKTTSRFGALAFLVLYTAFWRMRYRVLAMRQEADRIEESFAAARI